MAKFVFGLVFGIVLSAATIAFGPNGIDTKVKASGKVMVGLTEDVQFAYCKKEFLLDTQCFQKKKPEECEVLIKKKCG